MNNKQSEINFNSWKNFTRGEWPSQTWLQQRLAMVKLAEARQAVTLAIDGKITEDTSNE